MSLDCSTLPQSCAAAQGTACTALEPAQLEKLTPQICVRRRRANASVQPVPVPVPVAHRQQPGLGGRHSVLPGVQSHNGLIDEQRRGEVMCYSSHGLPARQRSTLCGHRELATLHSSCVERITPRTLASPPCPVARLPFRASCTRVRKRDEIMSVRFGTQALHKSRSGRHHGHRPLRRVTGTASQGLHEYAVHAVAGTPRQPPHGRECQCIVGTGVSGKTHGNDKLPNLASGKENEAGHIHPQPVIERTCRVMPSATLMLDEVN